MQSTMALLRYLEPGPQGRLYYQSFRPFYIDPLILRALGGILEVRSDLQRNFGGN
jgi:hypothetical protein